jgi:hypothetical protein
MAEDQAGQQDAGEPEAVAPVEPTELPEEALGDEMGDEAHPPGGSVEELLFEAEANRRRANASMSLVHKEHFALLFANCFFFAGSLAAWRALPYDQNITGGMLTTGLGTIRGAVIFALAIYGFWSLAIGLYTKKTVVWPFLLNMLFGLWVGLGGVMRGYESDEWFAAYDAMKKKSYTALDSMLTGPGTIAPGYWMLTGASLLVLFIIVKGIVGGATKSKASAAAAPEREGRRRR